jgi:hypothetical protein
MTRSTHPQNLTDDKRMDDGSVTCESRKTCFELYIVLLRFSALAVIFLLKETETIITTTEMLPESTQRNKIVQT